MSNKLGSQISQSPTIMRACLLPFLLPTQLLLERNGATIKGILINKRKNKKKNRKEKNKERAGWKEAIIKMIEILGGIIMETASTLMEEDKASEVEEEGTRETLGMGVGMREEEEIPQGMEAETEEESILEEGMTMETGIMEAETITVITEIKIEETIEEDDSSF